MSSTGNKMSVSPYYKSIFQSVTFWGAVATFIAAIFPNVYAHATGDTSTQNGGNVDANYWGSKVVAGITTLITIYGRFRANGQPPVAITGSGTPSS